MRTSGRLLLSSDLFVNKRPPPLNSANLTFNEAVGGNYCQPTHTHARTQAYTNNLRDRLPDEKRLISAALVVVLRRQRYRGHNQRLLRGRGVAAGRTS